MYFSFFHLQFFVCFCFCFVFCLLLFNCCVGVHKTNHSSLPASVLELYVKRNSAKALMKGILFGSFEHSHVTVEVERRDPDWSKVEDGEPISFPTLANKGRSKCADSSQPLSSIRCVAWPEWPSWTVLFPTVVSR